MKTFVWQPDSFALQSESGLLQSRVEFGEGYAQVLYKGLLRRWRLLFVSQTQMEFKAIREFLDDSDVFLWSQPQVFAANGAHPTRIKSSKSTAIDGRVSRLEFTFEIELVGIEFAEVAHKKYGRRDAGLELGKS